MTVMKNQVNSKYVFIYTNDGVAKYAQFQP